MVVALLASLVGVALDAGTTGRVVGDIYVVRHCVAGDGYRTGTPIGVQVVAGRNARQAHTSGCVGDVQVVADAPTADCDGGGP